MSELLRNPFLRSALSVLLAVGTSGSAFAVCPGFLAAPTYPIGNGSTQPNAVVVADFNGDGKNDVVTANIFNNSLSILLGNGDGTFGAGTNFGAGRTGYGVAVGDFNNDGKKDLVVADGGSGVDVFLGNGDGTFGAPANLAVGSIPYSVVVGDFNGDGKSDIATANYSSADVSILIGNGNGTFAASVAYPAGNSPTKLAVGDFNGDNKKDLVVANYFAQTVSILIGSGTGTFAAPVSYGVAGDYTTGVAVGDFNGDSISDLGVSNQSAVFVLIGIGNGTFANAVSYLAGAAPRSVAIGDVNGDGKADLAVADGDYDASILIGNGDGTLAPAVNYGTGSSPLSIAMADLNGDGSSKLDLVVANNLSNNVAILLSNGDGTFVARESFGRGNGVWVAVADFNGDGKLDTATVNQLVLTIHLGDGNGRLGPGVNYGAGSIPLVVTSGDFNKDGNKDLVVSNANDTIQIFIGNGNGTFAAPVPYTVGGSPTEIVVTDFNADGNPDLAVANYGSAAASVLLGNGNGTFGAPVNYATGPNPESIDAADFNGDGRKDLALGNYGNNSYSILIGAGNGTFAAPLTTTIGSFSPIGPTSIIASDFNADGRMDLVTNGSFGDVQIMLGNGNGTFAAPASFPADAQSTWLTALAVSDFNGDGRKDVAVGGVIVLGNGDGTLAAPIFTFANGVTVQAIPVVGDFNGDGRIDLALNSGMQGDVSILLKHGDLRHDHPDLTCLGSGNRRAKRHDHRNEPVRRRVRHVRRGGRDHHRQFTHDDLGDDTAPYRWNSPGRREDRRRHRHDELQLHGTGRTNGGRCQRCLEHARRRVMECRGGRDVVSDRSPGSGRKLHPGRHSGRHDVLRHHPHGGHRLSLSRSCGGRRRGIVEQQRGPGNDCDFHQQSTDPRNRDQGRAPGPVANGRSRGSSVGQSLFELHKPGYSRYDDPGSARDGAALRD